MKGKINKSLMPKTYTEEQKEIIQKYYPVLTPQEVADMTGIKKCNLIAYAYRHGISNNRFWTKEEEEYLYKWYGRMSAAAISKKIGKSYRSVIDKLQKCQIGNFIENTDDLILAEVCRLVGKDKETIKTTWVKYGLKIKKRGKYSTISQEDLIDFMKNNPERWDGTQYEYWFFQKYDWFNQKRILDREKMCNKRWSRVK